MKSAQKPMKFRKFSNFFIGLANNVIHLFTFPSPNMMVLTKYHFGLKNSELLQYGAAYDVINNMNSKIKDFTQIDREVMKKLSKWNFIDFFLT